MYTVTYYSFKGGVGRTMALVNTAVLLAQHRRRVLLVDFDLEAPGLTTYSLFSDMRETSGIIHYVHSYLDTNMAPHVEDYISKDIWTGPGGGSISVMPSGAQDPEYGRRLSEINWRTLYAERDGYLFFEDLRQQWESFGSFDYVLIDSRTGHTDIGGICTRQLPDAVVAMLTPTEQNIVGLAKVVRDIRREEEARVPKKIRLHFIMSNVPDLDDEDLILSKRIERATSALGCGDDYLTIRHYPSLALLDQSVFAIEHPRSRLASEYKEVVEAVTRENLQDRDGVLAHLKRLLARTRRRQALEASSKGTLTEIARRHSADGQVLDSLAMVYQRLGDLKEAVAMIGAAFDTGFSSADAHIRRAQMLLSLGKREQAGPQIVEDVRAVLNDETAEPYALSAAIQIISDHEPQFLPEAVRARGLAKMDAGLGAEMAQSFMSTAATLPVAEKLLRSALLSPEMVHEDVQDDLVLVLIGLGRFEEAMAAISVDRSSVVGSRKIRKVFNYAMAEWGALGVPSVELFQRVETLDARERTESTGLDDANYDQCLALTLFIVGRIPEARERLSMASGQMRQERGRVFSAWRYLKATRSEFNEDLEEIRLCIDGQSLKPRFMRSQLQLAGTQEDTRTDH